MSRAVQDRLAREQKKYAPYEALGKPEEIQERLARLDRFEKASQGGQPEGPSPEERDLRDLFTRVVPGIDKVPDLEARLAAMEKGDQQRQVAAGRDQIAGLAKEKFGELDASSAALIEGAVSASIGADKESLQRFLAGDRKVVSEHFATVFEKQLDPFLRGAAARYSSGKAADMAGVPPSTPKGGVRAPGSQEKALTPEERREAAWASFNEANGRG